MYKPWGECRDEKGDRVDFSSLSLWPNGRIQTLNKKHVLLQVCDSANVEGVMRVTGSSDLVRCREISPAEMTFKLGLKRWV